MSAVGKALAGALRARGGAGATILRATERCWASITFEGLRHEVMVELAAAAVDDFATGLEEAEIALPRHILADLVIDAREPCGEGRTRLVVAALTLADAGGTIARAPSFDRP